MKDGQALLQVQNRLGSRRRSSGQPEPQIPLDFQHGSSPTMEVLFIIHKGKGRIMEKRKTEDASDIIEDTQRDRKSVV